MRGGCGRRGAPHDFQFNASFSQAKLKDSLTAFTIALKYIAKEVNGQEEANSFVPTTPMMMSAMKPA